MLELALRRADQGQLDRPAIEVAYSSAKDLLELIGDILDIARIESGRLTLSPERANLRQLVESVIRVFDGLARQKSLGLQLDLDPRINTEVLIDPLRFKQILSNLISNAIKFTEQGQVRISLQTDASPDPQQLRLHVLIQDSGIGISQEDQQRLFEPFAQAENTGQLARTGAGLGLVICRSLCEMMGGTLVLSSEPGDGTQIHMTFDLTTLEPLEVVAPPKEALPRESAALDILIVDDHPANCMLLCQQLEFLGHHCSTAEQGAEGLEKWLQGQFDLVIADCNMPVMNGYDLTRSIRRHEQDEKRQRCTVWGFTANAQPEEKQRCQEAGMDDCLFKPISLKALNERLEKILPRAGRALETSTCEVFDMGSVSLLTGNRPEMVQRLLEQLLQSCEQDRQELSGLSALASRADMRQMAHKIKGAARIIRAVQVIDRCEALEDACGEAETVEIIEACQIALGTAMSILETALRAALHQADGSDNRNNGETAGAG
jgi:two-component system sensor histidine kinase EvgS